jgi:IS1 family transposase
MNILSRDKQIEIIAALTEGCSIRSVERLTGVHRDTIMRLGARVGRGCARLHDYRMVGLRVGRCELDELWSFVARKQKRTRPEDAAVTGDQYVFVALASASKAIVSYRVGKRNSDITDEFVADLRWRVIGQPEISTDGLAWYESAIRHAFGSSTAYGQIIKSYVGEPARDAARRYSPGVVVAVNRQVISGVPSQISTSYVERSNLTIRMSSRRFTRLTNGFSKKLENHEAAVGLLVAHYNLCRVHEATLVTPAMSLGLTDHPWSIGELLDAALGYEPAKPRVQRRFRVIQGGRVS